MGEREGGLCCVMLCYIILYYITGWVWGDWNLDLEFGGEGEGMGGGRLMDMEMGLSYPITNHKSQTTNHKSNQIVK